MRKLLLWFRTKRKLVEACRSLGARIRKSEIEDRTFRQRAFDAESILGYELRATIKAILKEHDKKHGTSTHYGW